MLKNNFLLKLIGLMILVGIIYAFLLEGANRLKSFGPAYHAAGIIIAVSLFILMFILLARWLMTGSGPNANELLAAGGQESKAIITKIQDTGMTVNNIYIMTTVNLKVTKVDGTQFEATCNGLFSRVQLPRIGDQVTVVYDPKNTKRVAIKTS